MRGFTREPKESLESDCEQRRWLNVSRGFVEQRPHHSGATKRDATDAVALARLVENGRQPQDRPYRFGGF